MSRETLADRYEIETVWKSSSGTIHTTDECYRLATPRARYNDIPAASIPVGHSDRCPSCWSDKTDRTGAGDLPQQGGEQA